MKEAKTPAAAKVRNVNCMPHPSLRSAPPDVSHKVGFLSPHDAAQAQAQEEGRRKAVCCHERG